ncbi:hypothetical protein E2493_16620 [Sphingomonas parva]|uniref:Uncharacterized protein n=1 Tax=Sphingomonas parva TaxID=2555898 RepID=A0A4Y8ZM97_9SPHN|nr:hypothetical protein [Sphingomonas parva]TFI57133.1 hypothetical protein E2493_16620 [Sphingomonas parva]
MDNRSGETHRLHDTLDFIGLRAHATTVGLLQLCTELVQAGTIDLQAIERIKGAIHREIMASHHRGHDREEFSRTLKDRLDTIFPHDDRGQREGPIGDVHEMQSALDTKI